MKISLKKGFSFGLTSGVITTLGLIIGLNSSTHSMSVILGGILVIAVADALSDAMGIHISEESQEKNNAKEVWEATFMTFFSKFIFALTFVIPIVLLPLETAIVVSIIWGLSLISIFSFYMAKEKGTSPFHVVGEHLLITVFVIAATHFIGRAVENFS